MIRRTFVPCPFLFALLGLTRLLLVVDVWKGGAGGAWSRGGGELDKADLSVDDKLEGGANNREGTWRQGGGE